MATNTERDRADFANAEQQARELAHLILGDAFLQHPLDRLLTPAERELVRELWGAASRHASPDAYRIALSSVRGDRKYLATLLTRFATALNASLTANVGARPAVPVDLAPAAAKPALKSKAATSKRPRRARTA